jgi:predicted transcriptional regulator
MKGSDNMPATRGLTRQQRIIDQSKKSSSKLKFMMQECGVSQKDIAEEWDWTPQALSKRLGEGNPQLIQIIDIIDRTNPTDEEIASLFRLRK